MAKKSLTLELPEEFLKLCEKDKVDPEVVLRGFIADLCSLGTSGRPAPEGYCTNGSDERLRAREYYERVGYPFQPGASDDKFN